MITQAAIMCLALNIYHESRSEPVNGQIAVAMVTMNRAEWKNEKVCDTVVKHKQFSWTNSMVTFKNATKTYSLKPHGVPKDLKAWGKSLHLARQVLKRKIPDITNGATHYHAKYVKPYWHKEKKRTVVIAQHIFYKDKPAKQS